MNQRAGTNRSPPVLLYSLQTALMAAQSLEAEYCLNLLNNVSLQNVSKEKNILQFSVEMNAATYSEF